MDKLPKGVYTSGKKFVAKLRNKGILIYLGTFVSVELAEKAYLDKQKELGTTGNNRVSL